MRRLAFVPEPTVNIQSVYTAIAYNTNRRSYFFVDQQTYLLVVFYLFGLLCSNIGFDLARPNPGNIVDQHCFDFFPKKEKTQDIWEANCK